VTGSDAVPFSAARCNTLCRFYVAFTMRMLMAVRSLVFILLWSACDASPPADRAAGTGTSAGTAGQSDDAAAGSPRDDGGSSGSNGGSTGAPEAPQRDGAICEEEVIVCSDFVDDDCDGEDEPCPTTQAAVIIPVWDCTGSPPTGVVAVARFGAKDCIAFFESSAGAIYVAALREQPAGGTSCPSFDERRYAYTLAGESAECPGIEIEADFSENPELAVQPVSNSCRKFLHPMSQPLSYVAANRKALEARIEAFETLELACVGYRDWPYKWESLLRATIELL